MTTSKPDVAVFIDFENIYVSVREKFDATPNFESIMDRCEDYGRVVIARAYADWYRYPRITSALFANGIEPMYVPTYYYDKDVGRQGRPIKNSVDMHLCIDAMRTLYSRQNLQRFILITGDRDFIPLVNSIRQEGKEVVIIGIGGAASSHLAQSADEFLFYEQIVEIRPMTPPVSAETRAERDRRPEKQAERSEDRVEKPPEKSAEIDVFDVLVEAINLARKRGYVASFGSLKVLMKELLPNFKESRYRDSSGKPFVKFTDFVREAERQERVQIFTSGTVNEVFLPGEDPYKLSQFAADLPSVEAERELEAELTGEMSSVAEGPSAAEMRSRRNGRDRRRRRPSEPQAEVQRQGAEQQVAEPIASEPQFEEGAGEPSVPVFGDQEWQFFLRAMSAFEEAAPFAEIFNELRELRNREELQLTNQELKELLKQGINQGILQRFNRGAKAHYRLHDSYRERVERALEAAGRPGLADEEGPLPDLEEDLELRPEQQVDAVELEQLPAQVDQDLPELTEVEVVFTPDMLLEQPEVSAAEIAEQPAAEAQPTAEAAPSRQRRRRKPTKKEAPQQTAPPVEVLETAPAAKVPETAAPAEAPEQVEAAAPKPRRRRRKTEEPAQVEAAQAEAASPKPRRRRRKTEEQPQDSPQQPE